MKIWKAELILFYTEKGNYNVKFIFEEQKGDYEINDINTDYVYSEGWVNDAIPINMGIEKTCYSGIKAIQGFDRKLTSRELEQLEQDMRIFMSQYLENEKDRDLKKYEKKFKIMGFKTIKKIYRFATDSVEEEVKIEFTEEEYNNEKKREEMIDTLFKDWLWENTEAYWEELED